MNSSFSNFLVFIFEELFDKGLNCLIKLIFGDRFNHRTQNNTCMCWISWKLHRTVLRGSFPRATTCPTNTGIRSGETILTKLSSDLTAWILTSTSASFSKCPKTWMRLKSATYRPKFSAISVKFFDKHSLTLQDLSSAAWIIKGMIYVLF